MSNCINNYLPEYVPQDISWHERDELMTWYDQAKSQGFLKNPDRHFKTTKVINFDIIRREAAGQKVPDEILNKYHIIEDERVSKYPKGKQNKFLFSAFRTDRPDSFFEKKVILNHFKQ